MFTIVQALAPCFFSRLLYDHRACLSRTLYSDFSIAGLDNGITPLMGPYKTSIKFSCIIKFFFPINHFYIWRFFNFVKTINRNKKIALFPIYTNEKRIALQIEFPDNYRKITIDEYGKNFTYEKVVLNIEY